LNPCLERFDDRSIQVEWVPGWAGGLLNEVRMNENADSLGDSSCVNKPVDSWSRVVLQNVDRRGEGQWDSRSRRVL
jgi:hypothetical protein